jgi:hypothetical protein
VALVSWPIAIIVATLLIGNIPTRYGTFTMDEHQLVLTILFAIPLVSSFILYRIDKEARFGEIYAKEKLAYHRDMDQYLELKRVYYESEAAKVTGNNGNDDE